jgi:Cu/Ag efflux protein CusF
MARNIAFSAYVRTFVLLVGCISCRGVVFGMVSEAGRHHALVGELEKVDREAKKITIRAADGTEHVVSYGDRTIVHGLKGTAKAADLAGKEGSRVVVHYTGAAGRETADHVDVFGHDALKTTEGTLTQVDKAGHKVVVKTSDGVDETYDLGRDSAIDTKDGLVDVAHFTGKEGDHVIVFHTEEGGRKVVHLLKHL